jgi:hypothetical protein
MAIMPDPPLIWSSGVLLLVIALVVFLLLVQG